MLTLVIVFVFMFAQFIARHGQHDALQDAHVPHLLLCVAFGAPRFGTPTRSFCECSKYVMFSLIICAHVLQATVCVASRARRQSVPSCLLGGILTALPARACRPVRIRAAEAAAEHPRHAQRGSPPAHSNHQSGIIRGRLRHAYEVA